MNPPCGKWGLVLDYIHRLMLDNLHFNPLMADICERSAKKSFRKFILEWIRHLFSPLLFIFCQMFRSL